LFDLYEKITLLFVELFVNQNLCFTSSALFFGWKISGSPPVFSLLQHAARFLFPSIFLLPSSSHRVRGPDSHLIPAAPVRVSWMNYNVRWFFFAWNLPALWFFLPVRFDCFHRSNKNLAQASVLAVSRWKGFHFPLVWAGAARFFFSILVFFNKYLTNEFRQKKF
jgi:hypothetical protein